MTPLYIKEGINQHGDDDMETYKINRTGEEFKAANPRAAMAIARRMGVNSYYGFSYKDPATGYWIPADMLP